MNIEIITELNVQNETIRVMRIGNVNYISLTDLAKHSNAENPSNVIIHWMSNMGTLDYIGLWEQLNNPDFNFTGFREIKDNEAGYSSFTLSPKRWIESTNAVGIYSKGGKYSTGTFAHPDIAFEFASWLSAAFKLYLIKEFERLKQNEAYQNKIEWHANRAIAKASYIIQTDAIKSNIIPTLTERQKQFIYAEEADVINVALFGMTAKQWRERNPELSKKGNIRDFTDILHLIILNNLENINAQLIKSGIPQTERIATLNNAAKEQVELLRKNKNLHELSSIEKEHSSNLIENN